MLFRSVEPNRGLCHNILTVLKKIGRGCEKPIFVEFSKSLGYAGIDDVFHLNSFLDIILYCQNQYLGPIIVVFSPVGIIKDATERMYNNEKREAKMLYGAARILGDGRGVPIIPMRIQEQTVSTCGDKKTHAFFINEPL